MNQKQASKLELSQSEMRALANQVVDLVIEHFDNLRSLPVVQKSTTPTQLREPIPYSGMDIKFILEQVKEDILDNIAHLQHPRFFAFVSSPSNFVSVMADTLASGFNVFAGTWLLGSGPAEVERVTIDWLRQLCGLPESAGGLFVSGGSMANLTALATARHIKLDDQIDKAVI